MIQYDLIVIGGGISGMTAALSALENGVKNVIIIEREDSLGGVVNQCIHSGFGSSILNVEVTGPEYVNFIRNRLLNHKIHIKLETEVIDLSKDKVITYVNSLEGVTEIRGSSIIFATGCREKFTGSINIATNTYTGINSIGNAHRVVNLEGYLLGKEPVIVASSKWALIVARRLYIEGANIKGVLIKENENFIFDDENKDIIEGFNMPIYLNSKVTEIFGDERVTGVKIGSSIDNKEIILGCDSLLLSVEYFPENGLLKNIKVEMDKETLAPIVNEYETGIKGVFACGNLIYGTKALTKKDINGGEAGKRAAEYIRNYYY